MMRQILTLDPAHYPRHSIHGTNRVWAETNCYVDVWIELLHAWGFEPIAALPFTLTIDFEGDQWTFFKFPHADLEQLFGMEVQELAISHSLEQHVVEQVARGRPVLVELDSYYLPDTAGTAYQREHVKSTVAVVGIDVPGRQLGYFHNQGYYHLEGTDFVHLFRLHQPRDPAVLPPYVEFVKPRAVTRHAGSDLIQASMRLLRCHLRRVPGSNPFEQFKPRFESDLHELAEHGLEAFHRYSFATLRQFGACYELAATYLQWLQEATGRSLDAPIVSFNNLARGAKSLQFQLARAIVRKKSLDLSALDGMAAEWQLALANVQETFL